MVKSKLTTSVINIYMVPVVYKIDLENHDGTLCKFKTAYNKVNEFLKMKPEYRMMK